MIPITKEIKKKQTFQRISIPALSSRSKQGWRKIGDKTYYFRSKWEANYARYLEFLKKYGFIKDWEHEPQTFWFEGIKRGVCSYLPDFKVTKTEEFHYWVEVKGYMDSASKTKIKRFNKYFPEEHLVVVNGDWFKAYNANYKKVIKGWE